MIANSPGTLSDITTSEYRALAFSIWSIGPLNGPTFGANYWGILDAVSSCLELWYLATRLIDNTSGILAGGGLTG